MISKNQTDVLLSAVLQALSGKTEWTSSDLLPFSRRALRHAAEHSDGHIISGNDGYKLATEATHAERVQCANRIRSQGLKNIQRSDAILAVDSAIGTEALPQHAYGHTMDADQVSPEAALNHTSATQAAA